MSTSWMAWARGLAGLTPTAKLVAVEISLLADARGVALVPLAHLAQATGRTPRAVREAVALLRRLGHVRRGPDPLFGKPLQSVRVQLLSGAASGQSAPPAPVMELPRGPGEPSAGTGEGDRTLAKILVGSGGGAGNEGDGAGTADLAQLLQEEGPTRFGKIIGRRKRLGHADDPWETLSIAWETAQQQRGTIAGAETPWGMWVHLTNLACLREDEVPFTTVLLEHYEPADSGAAIPWRGSGAEEEPLVFGFDDFDQRLIELVRALVIAGVPEATAWAGTARILELVDVGASRRHWLAAKDAKLQALGIGSEAARAWMTLLVGSRRTGGGALRETEEPPDVLAERVSAALPASASKLTRAG